MAPSISLPLTPPEPAVRALAYTAQSMVRFVTWPPLLCAGPPYSTQLLVVRNPDFSKPRSTE